MINKFETWGIKESRCDCCSGQGALLFVVCPQCRNLSIVCDEVGTVYLDPHDLDRGIYGGVDAGLSCPGCESDYNNFVPACIEEIKAAGFPDDFSTFFTSAQICDPRV